MSVRNAFAHGKFVSDENSVWFSFFAGKSQEQEPTDQYLTESETLLRVVFDRTFELLQKIGASKVRRKHDRNDLTACRASVASSSRTAGQLFIQAPASSRSAAIEDIPVEIGLTPIWKCYFPKTFLTSPIFFLTLPPVFSAAPRSSKSGFPVALPVSSLILPFAS